MDKTLNEFIWQGLAVLGFIASITLLLWMASEVDHLHELLREENGLGMIVNETDHPTMEQVMWGHQVFVAIKKGPGVTYHIEGKRYEAGIATSPTGILMTGQYRRQETLSDGLIQAVYFERIP